jgi:hypothetical protein
VVAIGGQIVVVDAPSASLNSNHADTLSLIDGAGAGLQRAHWALPRIARRFRFRRWRLRLAPNGVFCSFFAATGRFTAGLAAAPAVANPTACVATVRIGLSAQTALRRVAAPGSGSCNTRRTTCGARRTRLAQAGT